MSCLHTKCSASLPKYAKFETGLKFGNRGSSGDDCEWSQNCLLKAVTHIAVIDFTTHLLTIASRPLVEQVVFHFCWSYWPVGIFWRQNGWKFHEIFQDKKKLLSVRAMFINILKLFCQLLPHWLKVSSLTNHFPAFTVGKNGLFKTAIFVSWLQQNPSTSAKSSNKRKQPDEKQS